MRQEKEVRKLIEKLDESILETTGRFEIEPGGSGGPGRCTIYADVKDILEASTCTIQKAALHWVLGEPAKCAECHMFLVMLMQADLAIQMGNLRGVDILSGFCSPGGDSL